MFALSKPGPAAHELMPAVGDRPAVKVTFPAQPTLLALRAGRRAVGEALRAGGPDAEERAADAFTVALIRHSILSWEGIGDEEGEPVEPTPDVEIRNDAGDVIGIEPGTISAFLAEPRLVEAADEKWVLPWTMLDAEKNGLSLSPNGISEGATPAGDTANSPATPDASVDATTTTAAPPAPTIETKPAPKRAKPSGS
ncbi:hypothetical protein [Sphingomonas sp. CFBP 8760]|uniref:hypothetical protein n=1 Tax=Sphingomonas sp. CFBP 8760 TaxID=2775282 RepID=UPI00177F15F4|nr:hypothetical protein [Sphingomonas sp. CFBP 8760]MBD8548003.1 hypothetical protein [Sphingomonas sp. CFBP 8760]